MRFTNCRRWQLCSVLAWLATALLTIGGPASAIAQSTPTEITIAGADSTFKQVLTRPEAMFESLDLAPERVQQALADHPRVLVTDAGATRTVGMASFTDLTPPASPIDIQGAGSTRNIVARPVPDLENPSRLTVEVQIAGAGSVREVRPAVPAFASPPQEP